MGEWVGGIGALLAVLIAVEIFLKQRKLELADDAVEKELEAGRIYIADVRAARRIVGAAQVALFTRTTISHELAGTLWSLIFDEMEWFDQLPEVASRFPTYPDELILALTRNDDPAREHGEEFFRDLADLLTDEIRRVEDDLGIRHLKRR